jgi:hypothetical protein
LKLFGAGTDESNLKLGVEILDLGSDAKSNFFKRTNKWQKRFTFDILKLI